LTLSGMIVEYLSSSEYSGAPTTNVADYLMGSITGVNNAPKNATNRYMRPIRAF
jgi:hypothetical protein